ncbi:MAG: hypothetical protein JWO19_1215 [Bryobacterales bacterium]|nr:hypothetical protein [Bryobacterales bacterium]
MSSRAHTVFFWGIALALSSFLSAQAVSVQQFGARGDGSTDDADAIQSAINAAPAGSTIDFGGAAYTYSVSRTILLQSGRNYSGWAKIRLSSRAASGSPVLSLRDPYPSNVSLTGLTVDGNNVGNAFVVDFAENTSALIATNISIRNITAMNTVGQYAIYSPGTLDQTTITGNLFFNCSGGISVFSPNHLAITSNHFDTITRDNAITVMYNPVPVEYGQSLTIANNDGTNLTRMGIEVIGEGQSRPGSIVVSQNVFTGWHVPPGTSFFGISVFTGTGAQIVENVVEGAGEIGIEVGSAGALVADNLVRDFELGMTVEASNLTIQNNHFLHNAKTGIYVTNSRYSKQSTVITGNYIADAQFLGIDTSGEQWEGSRVSGNTILRSAVWPNDASTVFTGIGITPPRASVSITGNSIILETSTPIPGPGFIGIRINGNAGSNAQSRYEGNTIRTTGGFQGTGVYGNSPGSLDGVIFTNNSFVNLARATDGGSPQNPITSGNSTVQCLQNGLINLFQ